MVLGCVDKISSNGVFNSELKLLRIRDYYSEAEEEQMRLKVQEMYKTVGEPFINFLADYTKKDALTIANEIITGATGFDIAQAIKKYKENL